VAGEPILLFPEEAIAARVRQLAVDITADYAGREPTLVAILRGSVLFLADLVRRIDLPLSVDFMSISKYGDEDAQEGQSGVVRIIKDLEQDIGGRDVLVVEDIIDTGLTLSYLLTVLRAREPASLEVCTLLDKRVRRIPTIDIRYRGFECPDQFVVGYGLDLDEQHRNLPYIVGMPARAAGEEWPALDPYLVPGGTSWAGPIPA
jgi:hypoxanthine phosphoribosyltransferase